MKILSLTSPAVKPHSSRAGVGAAREPRITNVTRTRRHSPKLKVAEYQEINSSSFHDSNGHEQSRESTEFTTSSSSPTPPVENGVAAAAAGLIRSQRVGAGSQQMPTTAAALAATAKACAKLPYLTGWRTVGAVENGGDPY